MHKRIGSAAQDAGVDDFSGLVWTEVVSQLGLSQRESDMIPLLMKDESLNSIARSLGISRHTITEHLKRLYRKLKVNSRVQLIIKLLTHYFTIVTLLRDAEQRDFSK